MWPFKKRGITQEEYALRANELRRRYAKEWEESRPKVISEPVRAIAQAMKERPGSFRVTQHKVETGAAYTITDRATGLEAECHWYVCVRSIEHTIIHLPFDLTGDEQSFLWAEGQKWLAERRQRTKDYINAKRRREWSRKYGVHQTAPSVNREQRGRVGG